MEFETIRKLVKASGVKEGELILVHFWGEDTDREIANRFAAAVAALGASPMILQQARSANRDLFATAKAGCFDDRYFDMISKFDAVLDIFAYQPVILGYPLEAEQMELYRAYIARLFQALMSCKRFTQIRIPTAANAEESGLDPEDYMCRMNRAYDIDYDALSKKCADELRKFAGAERVEVRTGNGCVLRLEVLGREWLIDAGDGDLPCGEIYVAPVEDRTNGRVYFESLWLEDVKYTDVTLEIVNGEVSGSSNEALAKKFAEMPRENRIVCELGLGMNANVEDLCGYTLLDEKMAGTFHIAIGMNLMFGGKNEASGHTDFVGCGKIEVIG